MSNGTIPREVVEQVVAHWEAGQYAAAEAKLRAALSAAAEPVKAKTTAMPQGMKITRTFLWDGVAQHHVPQLLIDFEPVPAGLPNDAKGWVDRNTVATMLAALPSLAPAGLALDSGEFVPASELNAKPAVPDAAKPVDLTEVGKQFNAAGQITHPAAKPETQGERKELIAYHSEQYRKFGNIQDKQTAALLSAPVHVEPLTEERKDYLRRLVSVVRRQIDQDPETIKAREECGDGCLIGTWIDASLLCLVVEKDVLHLPAYSIGKDQAS